MKQSVVLRRGVYGVLLGQPQDTSPGPQSWLQLWKRHGYQEGKPSYIKSSLCQWLCLVVFYERGGKKLESVF